MSTLNLTPRVNRWILYYTDSGGVDRTLDFSDWVTSDQIAMTWGAFSQDGVLYRQFDVNLQPRHTNVISVDPFIEPQIWAKGNRVTRTVQLTNGTPITIFDGFVIDTDPDDGYRDNGVRVAATTTLTLGDNLSLARSRRPPADDPTFTTATAPLGPRLNAWLNQYNLPSLTTTPAATINHPVPYDGREPITDHVGKLLLGHAHSVLYSDYQGNLHAKEITLEPGTPALIDSPANLAKFRNQRGESEKPVGEVIVTGTADVPIPYADPPTLIDRQTVDLGMIETRITETRFTKETTVTGPRGFFLASYEDLDEPETILDGSGNDIPNPDRFPFSDDSTPITAEEIREERFFAGGPPARAVRVETTTKALAGSFLPGITKLGAPVIAEQSVETLEYGYSNLDQVQEVDIMIREPAAAVKPGASENDLSLTDTLTDNTQWSYLGPEERYSARRKFFQPYANTTSSPGVSATPPETTYLEATTAFDTQQIEQSCAFDYPTGSPALDRVRTFNIGKFLASDEIAANLCQIFAGFILGRSRQRLVAWPLTDALLQAPIQPLDIIEIESRDRPGYREILRADAVGVVSSFQRFYGTCLGVFVGWREIATGEFEAPLSHRPQYLTVTDPADGQGEFFPTVTNPLNPAEQMRLRI